MRAWARLTLALAAAASGAVGCRAQSTEPARGELLVAQFTANASGGAPLPDVATQLADRLGTLGVGPVIGPAALGGAGEPTPSERAKLRERTGARALVVGSATRLGSQVSLDARLLDLATGAALGPPLVEQAASADDLPRAIDALAQRVAARLEEPAGAVPAAAATASPAPKKEREPIEINADQLEARSVEGGRQLIFVGHVKAVQGEVTLACDHLEAFYPTGKSDPDKITALGNISVRERDRTATCDEAVFYRSEDRIVCQGKPAQLTQECDRVTGDRISFQLDTEKLEVEGNSRVEVRPCAKTAPGTPP